MCEVSFDGTEPGDGWGELPSAGGASVADLDFVAWEDVGDELGMGAIKSLERSGIASATMPSRS